MKGRDHLEDLSVGGMIILKWVLKTGCEGVDWIQLAQDKVQWQTIGNIVVNVQLL
jgi:hypothetical protein